MSSAAAPTHALLIEVRLHEPRFHGRPEWPPSPARLFQALVAGASARLGAPEVVAALRWLEERPPPLIAAPRKVQGQTCTFWVPNNDLDAEGGDPAAVVKLRVGKTVSPQLLQPDFPFLYAWWMDEADAAHARVVVELADGLYQFGRGVDPGWARGEVVEAAVLEARLAAHPGVLHWPGGWGGGVTLPCPRQGSFDSLQVRYAAQRQRFAIERVGRRPLRVFRQPPKALFRDVTYDGAVEAVLFDLRPPGAAPGVRFRGRLERVYDLVVAIRDAAAARLKEQLPEQAADIDAVLVGRRPGEEARVPLSQRVRIVPLPSIGHAKVDRSPRRVLVQFPRGGPVRVDDLRWAFSGLSIGSAVLVEAQDVAMLERYAAASRTWRSVTPVVLPERAARRRIEPTRITEEVKGAEERALEEAQAAEAVADALRHAGVRARVLRVEVRREPWSERGLRAEAFAEGTRFAKERLWHVAVTLDRTVDGPLVIGDGRFLGLGLLAPERVESPGALRGGALVALRVASGLVASPDPEGLARALRRAVMARVQEALGPRRSLPTLFSGHEPSGEPARGHAHLAFQFDEPRGRLVVWVPRGTSARDRARLDAALEGLTDLRAGAAGRLVLAPAVIDDGDPLVAAATRWTSVTPYAVRRHAKGLSPVEAVARDVRDACRAAGLPVPEAVEVRDVHAPSGRGLRAQVTLTFAVAVPGPLLLGRTAHLGGGMFEGRW